MKVIAVGDPHFQVENIPEVEMFIEKLVDLATNEKPNFIVVLGDILHTHERIHTMPLNKAYELIRRLKEISPVYVLVGNHDMVNNSQFLSPNHWMNAMKEWSSVTIVDTVHSRQEDGYNFFFVPYVPNGRFEEALNSYESKETWKEADCIFAHQEFFGCKMGAILSADGDKWSESNPYVISGHIHSKQSIGPNIYYCGASLQHAFGESEDTIIPVLTWDEPGNKYDLNEVDLGLPKKKIIYTDVSSIQTFEPTKNGDKTKISLSGSYEEFKSFKKTQKYRDLSKKGIKIVFKPEKVKKRKDDKKGCKQGDLDKEQTTVTVTDFNETLLNLVLGQKDKILFQVYEEVVNNKIIQPDDILFL